MNMKTALRDKIVRDISESLVSFEIEEAVNLSYDFPYERLTQTIEQFDDGKDAQIQQLREALNTAMRGDWREYSTCVDGFVEFVTLNYCHEIALAMNETGGDL